MKSLLPTIALLVVVMGCVQTAQDETDVYRAAALQAASWLQANALERPEGTAWAADPQDTTTVSTDLYSGSSGVVLFFLEAYRVTGQTAYLDQARAGADYLLATLPDTLGPGQKGLYTGVAGLGFVLEETYRATEEEAYREGARRCIDLLKAHADTTENGITWSGVTDIVSGSAGTGLFLLYAARQMNHPDALDLAVQAGRELVAQRVDQAEGAKWAMHPDFPRLMPNFSHGTAGVAYYLTELYRATNDSTFLDAALEGAAYLRGATTDDGLLFHHEPDGEDLFYLSWCHGPPGTARLYYRLWQITQDEIWLDAVHEAARSVMHTGIPDTLTAGFWNNVSQCCGSAGVAEFFHALYQVTERPEYRDFAAHVTDNLLARATMTEDGYSWVQAEHRVQPDNLVAQTGFMQGAAGIGIWLLRLSDDEADADARITLPDSPW